MPLDDHLLALVDRPPAVPVEGPASLALVRLLEQDGELDVVLEGFEAVEAGGERDPGGTSGPVGKSMFFFRKWHNAFLSG